jgi:hypothetical protein
MYVPVDCNTRNQIFGEVKHFSPYPACRYSMVFPYYTLLASHGSDYIADFNDRPLSCGSSLQIKLLMCCKSKGMHNCEDWGLGYNV